MDVSKEGTDRGAQTTSPLTHPPTQHSLASWARFPHSPLCLFRVLLLAQRFPLGWDKGGRNLNSFLFWTFVSSEVEKPAPLQASSWGKREKEGTKGKRESNIEMKLKVWKRREEGREKEKVPLLNVALDRSHSPCPLGTYSLGKGAGGGSGYKDWRLRWVEDGAPSVQAEWPAQPRGQAALDWRPGVQAQESEGGRENDTTPRPLPIPPPFRTPPQEDGLGAGAECQDQGPYLPSAPPPELWPPLFLPQLAFFTCQNIILLTLKWFLNFFFPLN